MKERIYYLDVIRVIACLMVLLMHSTVRLNDGESGLVPGLITYIMLPCNGLFFMTSGAVLFGPSLSLGEFMKKRLSRIVWPVVIWSIVNIICDAYTYDVPMEKSIKQLFWIPFHNVESNGTFWFMYALLGCYLVVPIIEPWLKKATKGELEAVLLMWVISLSFPIITFYLDMPAFDHRSAWYYYGGFIGYFILGWYMTHYEISWKKIILSFVLAVLIFAVIKLQQTPDKSAYDMETYCYLLPSTICYCFGLFGLIMKLVPNDMSDKSKTIFTSLSACTFGVYLIHVLFLTRFLKRTDWLDSLSVGGAIGVRWILTAIFCFIVISLLRKLPYSKYIVG